MDGGHEETSERDGEDPLGSVEPEVMSDPSDGSAAEGALDD